MPRPGLARLRSTMPSMRVALSRERSSRSSSAFEIGWSRIKHVGRTPTAVCAHATSIGLPTRSSTSPANPAHRSTQLPISTVSRATGPRADHAQRLWFGKSGGNAQPIVPSRRSTAGFSLCCPRVNSNVGHQKHGQLRSAVSEAGFRLHARPSLSGDSPISLRDGE